MKPGLIIIMIILFFQGSQAQSRYIRTAVDYLLLAPDARGTSLGTTGAASRPDMVSMHWNPAKYAFLDKKFGVAISYTPWYWLKTQDYDPFKFSFGYKGINLFFKIRENMAVATSMAHYALGDITFTDEFGNELGVYKPWNIYNDVTFAYRINNVITVAMAGRFIYSKLTQGQFVQGTEISPGISVAMDLSTYYNRSIAMGDMEGIIAWGINISNIGSKISYSETAVRKNFIPTNLKAGAGFTTIFNPDHSLSVQADLNKLLVPSPPVYLRDSLGNPVYDDDGDPVIEKGMDPNVSVLRGMLQSWYDAPGGFKEEMQEWSFGIGFEYRFKDILSPRIGVYYENETKGTRRYFTAGVGFRIGQFGFDTGIMVPFEEIYFNAFNMRSSILLEIGSRNQ